jgi:fatty-acyl-CoA synthase
LNIANLLAIAVQIDPERTIASDYERNLTLHGLAIAAQALSKEVTTKAKGSGAVALVGVNSVAVPVAFFGSALAGRAMSPLNFRADDLLLTYLLGELKPAVIVADDQYRARIEVLTHGNIPLISSTHLADPRGSEPLAVPAETGVPAVLMFTSGTSARPKIVALRHQHLSSYVLSTVEAMSEAPTAVSLISSPAYHIAAIANILTSTFSGRRMFFLRSFTGPEWLDAAKREKVTHAFVVPTMLHRIVTELKAGAKPPSALITLAYGGAPAAPSLVLDALRLFSPHTGFVNAYGLTETSSTISVLSPEDHRLAAASDDQTVRARISSVGRPLPGVEVSVSSPDGVGEILVRGGQVSGEYKATASRVDVNGWFHTGDIGRWDKDGFLYVVGRIDDMIIRGGENISPLEIEEVLLGHAAVADVAVVGLADKEWGQTVAAAVVLSGDVTQTELIHWARERLPSFKCPTTIKFVSQLPRNDMGKLQRFLVGQAMNSRLDQN